MSLDQILLTLLEFSRTLREILSSSTLSIFLGTIILGSYLYKNRAKLNDRVTIINAAAVFGGSMIILPGLAMMILSYDKETCEHIKIDQKFVLVGGFVMTGLGLQSLVKNYNL